MILDGNSLVNRAFYGVRSLCNRNGVPTNAIYGFFTTYIHLFNEINPDGVCVCFDLKAPTFRHKEYDGYKAGRRPMPEELVAQIPILKNILDLLGIPRFELEGYEADDLIGTISAVTEQNGGQAVIVTGDRDSFQLISKATNVLFVTTKAGAATEILYTKEKFAEDYAGLPPKAIIDFKGLSGDASDNIPGVDGIGEKRALALLEQFGSIDEIYSNIESEQIKPALRKKLIEGKESAFFSRRLATICRDVPMNFTPDMAKLQPRHEKELFDTLSELELKTLIVKFGAGKAPAEKPEKADVPFKIISDPSMIHSAIEAMRSQAYVGVYSEPPYEELAVRLSPVVYIFRKSDFGEAEWKNLLSSIFGGKAKLVYHDFKPFLRHMLEIGLNPCDIFFDTAAASYLLKSSVKPTLANSAYTFLNKAEFNGEATDSRFADAASAVAELYDYCAPQLLHDNMQSLMNDIEMPLVRILAETEHNGVRVDSDRLAETGAEFDSKIKAITEQIYQLAGHTFNLNSTRETGEVLFEELQLPPSKKTKTGYSTNIDVLQSIRLFHPIVPLIIEYRELIKIKSTYIDGIAKAVCRDNKVHTTFEQFSAVTGRLSSSEPNLQSIPVRKASGAEIRKIFVASPGCVLVDADYSQIELRILAHIANDENMLAAFNNNYDIHAATASQVFNVPIDEVTNAMRSSAKAVNFGIVYGISDFSLAQDLGVTRRSAKEYIENYLNHYHGIKEYMARIKEQAKENGYVTSLFGRRRYIPELKASNFVQRSFGERAAMNAPIQSTAADIIKIAMIRVYRRLKAEKLDAKLILQVHDELIIDTPIEECKTVCKLLKDEMEAAYRLKAPLIAEAHFGKSWYDAK